jgi:hypothetical protein
MVKLRVPVCAMIVLVGVVVAPTQSPPRGPINLVAALHEE